IGVNEVCQDKTQAGRGIEERIVGPSQCRRPVIPPGKIEEQTIFISYLGLSKHGVHLLTGDGMSRNDVSCIADVVQIIHDEVITPYTYHLVVTVEVVSAQRHGEREIAA